MIIKVAAALAILVPAFWTGWVTFGSITPASAQFSNAECEKIYQSNLRLLQEQAKAAKTRARVNFARQEADLLLQQARAEHDHKKAITELIQPGEALRRKCQAIHDNILAIEREVAKHTSTLNPDLGDADWQAKMATIKALKQKSDRAENDLTACRASRKAAYVPYGKRQKTMFAKASNASLINGLVNQHLQSKRQTLEDLDTARLRDIARLDGLKAYCEKHKIWAGGDGSKLAASCLCEIRAELAALAKLLGNQRKLRDQIREARRKHLEDFAELMRDVRNQASDASGKLAGASGEANFGFWVDMISGTLDVADWGYGAIKSLRNKNRLKNTDSTGLYTPPGTETGEVAGAAKTSRKAADAFNKSLKALATRPGGSKLISQKLWALASSRQAFDALVARLETEILNERKAWNRLAAIKCLRNNCDLSEIAEKTRKHNAAIGAGQSGRRLFISRAFNKAGPSHRLYLANCDPCKSLTFLIELLQYRDLAAQTTATLGRTILDQHRTILDLNVRLAKALGRETHGGFEKLIITVGMIGGSIINPVAGIGLSLADYYMLELEDIYIPGIGTIEGEHASKRRVEKNLTADLKRTIGYFDQNQIDLVYWRHYANSLDRELGDALARLIRCFDRDCDKTARLTPGTNQLQGPPGEINRAPGDEPASLERMTTSEPTAEEIDVRLSKIPEGPAKALIRSRLAGPDIVTRHNTLRELGFVIGVAITGDEFNQRRKHQTRRPGRRDDAKHSQDRKRDRASGNNIAEGPLDVSPAEIKKRLGKIPDGPTKRAIQARLASPDLVTRQNTLRELGFSKNKGPADNGKAGRRKGKNAKRLNERKKAAPRKKAIERKRTPTLKRKARKSRKSRKRHKNKSRLAKPRNRKRKR